MSETNINPPLYGKPSTVSVYGIPMDLGQRRRGVDMGPSAIRNANLHTILKGLDIEIVDRGDADTKIPETLQPDPTAPFDKGSVKVDMDQTSPEERLSVAEAAAWLEVSEKSVLRRTHSSSTIRCKQGPDGHYWVYPKENILRVEPIKRICDSVVKEAATISSEGHFPIFLGGDHSISIGTISGIAKAEDTGVIWLDAHADFNTPKTSPTGNVHGMPLAVLTGRGHRDLLGVGGEGRSVQDKDVVIIGLRSLDFDERESLREWGANLYDAEDRETGCCIYTMKDIDTHGVGHIVSRALNEDLAHVKRVHLSFDLDVMDREVAPGVGTPEEGGLTYREARLIMEILSASRKITSLDIVEVNPTLDRTNRTAEVAVDLTASLMGNRRYGLAPMDD